MAIPIFKVPDEGDYAIRLQNTSKLLGGAIIVWAPMECLKVEYQHW